MLTGRGNVIMIYQTASGAPARAFIFAHVSAYLSRLTEKVGLVYFLFKAKVKRGLSPFLPYRNEEMLKAEGSAGSAFSA